MSSRRLAVAAAAATAVIALVVFLVVMSQSDYRRTWTNSVVVPAHAALPPGGRFCQAGELVPAGSRFAAPWVGGHAGAPGGPATVTVSAGGRTLVRGRSPASYPTGITRFALDHEVRSDLRDVTVCFTNRSARVLNVYGDPTTEPRVSVPRYGDGVRVLARLDWYGGRKTWWQTAGMIADRFPLTKAAFLGPWAMWACLVALLALGIAAVVRVVREAPR